MIVFADTSGLYALLASNDDFHLRARHIFSNLADAEAHLVTTSYVLVETLALLQSRIGLDAVKTFEARLLPLLDVLWVDAEWHTRAITRLMLEGRRQLSLVDCLSFEVMQVNNIKHVFSFDQDFEQAGFEQM